MTQSTRQQEDLDLWQKWKSTGRSQYLSELMQRLQPLLFREVRKWGMTVPPAVMESKGRRLMVDALENYDPSRGAAIATHVTTRLKKLSRSAYPMQNVARLPENKQLQFNSFQVAQGAVMDRTGREATVSELADELGWSSQKVRSFQQSFGRRELVESEGLWGEADEDQMPVVDFFFHGLAPDDQALFSDVTGYEGKTPLKNERLRSKYNFTQGQLSYRKRKLTNKLRAIQQGQV